MIKTSGNLIPIKKSHILLYNNFPLYYISADGKPVLYKKEGEKIDREALAKEKTSKLYIQREDESIVVEKLISSLNRELFDDISSKGISEIRKISCMVVKEALQGPHETSLNQLPETIEIIFNNAKEFPGLLEALASIKSVSDRIVDHSVNVLSLTAQYCLFKGYSDDENRKFGLCALLHDLGAVRLGKELVETKSRLSDNEYEEMKTHTTKGYNDLKSNRAFHEKIALTALEHHELLDGTGYPSGIKNMCYESQVIGLIDSYEPLKYDEKTFRKPLKAYDALQILKDDVLQGKYNRQVFKDLCTCLTK